MDTTDLSISKETVLEVLELADLERANYPTCDWYSSRILSVKNDGLEDSVSFLYRLCVLQLCEENAISIYSRSHTDWNERSFSDKQLDVLEEILPTIVQHDLKGRIHDILWIRRRSVEHARLASEEFIDAGISCIKADCIDAGTRFGRGLRIIKSLGRKEPLTQTLSAKVLNALKTENITESVLVTAIHELLLGRLLDVGDLLDLSENGAVRATKAWVIQRFHELVRKCSVHLGEKAKEVAAIKNIVQSLEEEADSSEVNALKAHKLKAAIHTLRQMGGDDPDIVRLHSKLLSVQSALSTEFKSFPVAELDISVNAQQARDRIVNRSKYEAIATLINATEFLKSHDVEKNAVESIRNFPFQNMFFVEKLSTTSKTAASVPPAGNDEIPPERVFYQMLTQYRIYFDIVAAGTILPMIDEINLRHHVTYLDIAQLVDRSPYIPDHHHDFFCAGIMAGIQGRMIEALHCLVPQLEAVLRKILVDHKVIVSALHPQSTQREFDLNKILLLEDSERILSKDIITVFRALFTEQAGLNLRNELSHGMITVGQCFSYSSVFAWWVIVWLVLHPVANEILLQASSTDSPSPLPTTL